jgi:hypothetical protein
LSKTTSKTLNGLKYVYLIAFFALLSGFFNPLITNTNFQSVIFGVIILFVGFVGSVLIYKSFTSENRNKIFLGGGFGLIAISFFYIFQITGRI